MSEKERFRKRKPPPLFRERTIPPDSSSRAELIRSLTIGITALEAHAVAGEEWRDWRQFRALERMINTRGEAFERLRAETPAVWKAISTELDLT